MGCVANRPVENPILFEFYDSDISRTDELIVFPDYVGFSAIEKAH